jgi:hypothetical protein
MKSSVAKSVWVGAACAFLMSISPVMAAADTAPTDVTFDLRVDGSRITNTIMNNTPGRLNCDIQGFPAPDGVAPSAEYVSNHSPYFSTVSFSVYSGRNVLELNAPDGTYVIVARCFGNAVWHTDYPGLSDVRDLPRPLYPVPPSSPVVTFPGVYPAPIPSGPGCFGSVCLPTN